MHGLGKKWGNKCINTFIKMLHRLHMVVQGLFQFGGGGGGNQDFKKLGGLALYRLSCVVLIIAHLRGQNHFQGGGGANCPLAPAQTF